MLNRCEALLYFVIYLSLQTKLQPSHVCTSCQDSNTFLMSRVLLTVSELHNMKQLKDLTWTFHASSFWELAVMPPAVTTLKDTGLTPYTAHIIQDNHSICIRVPVSVVRSHACCRSEIQRKLFIYVFWIVTKKIKTNNVD